jgi:hypothetical protein
LTLLSSTDPLDISEGLVLAASVGQPGAVINRLVSLIDERDQDFGGAAAQALAINGVAEALPPMIAELDQRPPRDGYGLAWAIARLGSTATDPGNVEAARDALERYRRRARGGSRTHAIMLLRLFAVLEE